MLFRSIVPDSQTSSAACNDCVKNIKKKRKRDAHVLRVAPEADFISRERSIMLPRLLRSRGGWVFVYVLAVCESVDNPAAYKSGKS